MEVMEIDSITQAIEMWHALVALLAPLLIGLITNEQTRGRIKKLLPVIVSAGTWAITYFGGTELGAEVLVLVPSLYGAILMAYEFYGGVVSIVKGQESSVNDVLMPQRALLR